MPTERVVEIPWALMQLPQTGTILDVGSCDATYLSIIQQADRQLHCLDPRNCADQMPLGALFHHQNLIDNTLPRNAYDAVLLLSVLEHVGLPAYGQNPFLRGDQLALEEVWDLLRPQRPLIVTVPVGQKKLVSWYRQYSPDDLHRLFGRWRARINYWGYDGEQFVPVSASEVARFDYREFHNERAGAGAFAGIVAYRSS